MKERNVPYRVMLDDELVEAVKEQAEPLVDSVNSVLRRLAGLRPAPQSSLFFEIERVDAPAGVAPARDAATASARPAQRRRKARARAGKAKRAPKGSLLDERAYWTPILEVLAAAPDGAAPAREVITKVGAVVDDQLTPLDREEVGGGGQRWQGRVQFARLRMKDAGLLEADSPRGVWQISTDGRRALEKARAAAA